MPISAAVITLDAAPTRRNRALSQLERHPNLVLGEMQALHLPVVVDTDDLSTGIRIVRDELPELEGVEFVHIVSVDFSDLEGFDEKLPPRRARSKAPRKGE